LLTATKQQSCHIKALTAFTAQLVDYLAEFGASASGVLSALTNGDKGSLAFTTQKNTSTANCSLRVSNIAPWFNKIVETVRNFGSIIDGIKNSDATEPQFLPGCTMMLLSCP
jgi:hypothetical protein